MQVHERVRRALAATCATLAIAAVPSTASAMPASEQPRAVSGGTALEFEQVRPGGEPATSTGGGDQILTLVLSGAALLVALGSAGYASRVGQRVAKPSH